VADPAQATPVDETTDFGDDFASRTLLPIGTDVVNGNVSAGADIADHITFQGLLPGGFFNLTSTDDGGANQFTITQLDDGGGFAQTDSSPNAALSGTIPASGELHFNLFAEGEGSNYALNLSAPLPEPASAALLGGGLLAAAALRRLRGRHRG
jgi:hypothetical protein